MAQIIRAFFRTPDVYWLRADPPGDLGSINWEDHGEYPDDYLADNHTLLADYCEKEGHFKYLIAPLANGVEPDLAWLKEHPRSAHREVFPRGEIIDEANGDKVVKVLKNVTLLDMLEALKEFMPKWRD